LRETELLAKLLGVAPINTTNSANAPRSHNPTRRVLGEKRRYAEGLPALAWERRSMATNFRTTLGVSPRAQRDREGMQSGGGLFVQSTSIIGAE